MTDEEHAEHIRLAIAFVCNADRRAVIPAIRALGDAWTVEQLARLHQRAEELSPSASPDDVAREGSSQAGR